MKLLKVTISERLINVNPQQATSGQLAQYQSFISSQSHAVYTDRPLVTFACPEPVFAECLTVEVSKIIAKGRRSIHISEPEQIEIADHYIAQEYRQ